MFAQSGSAKIIISVECVNKVNFAKIFRVWIHSGTKMQLVVLNEGEILCATPENYKVNELENIAR